MSARDALAARAARGCRSPPSSARRSRTATGSALLAANAGSGKTAVMVERFVEAVLEDGVPVGAILALTFTEKAAGELRDRVRRRFRRSARSEHAREAERRWVGTIHGFCARVLRARPLAAGLDPRFEVLDEAAAERLAARRLRRARSRPGPRRAGPPAVDVAAAYGAGLRDLVARRPRDAALARRRRARGCRSRRARAGARSGRRSPPPRRGGGALPRHAPATADGSRRGGHALGGVRARCSARAARARAGRARRRRAQAAARKALEHGAVRGLPRGLGGVPPALRRPPRARRAGR